MKSIKKRSRKSKLVPRECLDSDDENIADMQNEIEQTIAKMTSSSSSILKKLSRQTEEPLKFSIKVEIEEVDEPINTQIKEEEQERELNIAIDSVVSLKDLLEKTNCPVTILSGGLDIMQCEEHMIRYEFDRISKQTTSKADKLIEIHMRNIFGRRSSTIGLCDKEFALQSVIGKWKNWQALNPLYRDVPLLYKCVICLKAWWHYYDFRQHFYTHNRVKLDIETSGHVCSVIAFNKKQVDCDIPIDENCWQCGQDFQVHQIFKKFTRIYQCKGCFEKFISCVLLNEHTGSCKYFKRTLNARGIKTNNVISCILCPVKCFSEIELDKHLKAKHSVRSDLPAVIHLQKCPNCNYQSTDINLHECNNLISIQNCEFCKRNFRKVSNFLMHQIVIKKNHKCPICGKVLLADCMELEHLLSHSDNYSMVYKCKLCSNPVYMLNEEMIKKHGIECHRSISNVINMHFFKEIVIPKTILKIQSLLNTDQIKKFKSKGNIADQQHSQEKINGLGNIVSDIHKCDSKKDNADENIDKPTDGETNTNIDTVITNIKAISDNIDKVSTKINDVLTDIDIGSNNVNPLAIEIKKEKPDYEDNFSNELSPKINIKQEPMEVDININSYNEDNIQNLVVKEEIIDHVLEVCDLNDDVKIAVKDEPIDDVDFDMMNDNDSENNDDNKKDKDFKLLCKSKIYSCTKCPYKGVHRHYKQHILVHQNSFYTCTKCNTKYQSMKNYLCHFQKHNYSPLTCPKCLKQLPVINELVTHVYKHIKNNFVGVHFIKKKTYNKTYQCRQCRDNLGSRDFFVHWESHIEIQKLGTGSETVKLLDNKPILQDVIALLQGETPEKELQSKQCVMCLKNFSRKNDLKRHLIEHLLRDAYVNKDKYGCLKCQICCIGFNKIDIYKRHMRDHGSLPLYKCELCDKTFSDSSNFSKHKKVHNLSVLVCDICKKKFTCKNFLIKHMEMHDKMTPIVCECCRRVFHSPSLYRKHRNGRYRFKCPICSVSFDALKEKWDHMWLEHNERKYLADCPICKKSFRKYRDVKMHIRKTHDSKYVYKPVFVKINKNEEVIVCE